MNTLGAASLTRRTDMSDFTLPAREGQPFLFWIALAKALSYAQAFTLGMIFADWLAS